MKVGIEIAGLEKVKAFFRNAAVNLLGGKRSVEVYFANAGRNRTIAAVQAGAKRNPFYLSKNEEAEIASIMRSALTDALHRISRTPWRDGLRIAGEHMAEDFRAHIDGRKSGTRLLHPGITRTRPLTPKYAKQKLKRWGKVLPELRASDEFYESMRVRVTK